MYYFKLDVCNRFRFLRDHEIVYHRGHIFNILDMFVLLVISFSRGRESNPYIYYICRALILYACSSCTISMHCLILQNPSQPPKPKPPKPNLKHPTTTPKPPKQISAPTSTHQTKNITLKTSPHTYIIYTSNLFNIFAIFCSVCGASHVNTH